jgi:L-fucose mutarotase
MLTTKLLHPEILKALASSGHFSQVLIADGNFPVASRSSPSATRVFLNLMPGIVKTTDVLEALLATIPIQDATVMEIPAGTEAPVISEYLSMLPPSVGMNRLERFAFYDAVSSPNTTLVIATGDTRRFANILLTIGVVKLEDSEKF